MVSLPKKEFMHRVGFPRKLLCSLDPGLPHPVFISQLWRKVREYVMGLGYPNTYRYTMSQRTLMKGSKPEWSNPECAPYLPPQLEILLCELLKIQKFGHLLERMLFFYSIF